MLITPEVARDIAQIIRDHHSAVAAALFGREAVSEAEWKLAVDLGLVSNPEDWEAVFGGLHEVGAFLAHLGQAAASDRYGHTLESFIEEIKRNPIPRTQTEHHAAQWNARRGAAAVTGLGGKAASAAVSIAQEQDAELGRTLRDVVRDVISARFGDDDALQRVKEEGVAQGLSDDFFDRTFRGSIKQTTSDIGHATGQWTRDIQRIAQTEGHTAINQGIQEAWIEQEEGQSQAEGRAPRRVMAYKLPRPDACKHCIRLHLSGGIPRLYWLDEIAGNGTNVGKRADDWNVVVGSTHPWCGCTLHRVPFVLVKRVIETEGWHSGLTAPDVIGAGGGI